MNVGIEVSEPNNFIQNVNAALCQTFADSIDISFGLFIHLNLGLRVITFLKITQNVNGIAAHTTIIACTNTTTTSKNLFT